MILDGDYSFSSVDFNGELANILWGCYVDYCFFLKLSADPWLNAELATLINGEIDIFELIKKLSNLSTFNYNYFDIIYMYRDAE